MLTIRLWLKQQREKTIAIQRWTRTTFPQGSCRQGDEMVTLGVLPIELHQMNGDTTDRKFM